MLVGDMLKHISGLVMKLSEEDKTSVVKYHKRLKLCRQYFLLLHRMLYYALDKLSKYGGGMSGLE